MKKFLVTAAAFAFIAGPALAQSTSTTPSVTQGSTTTSGQLPTGNASQSDGSASSQQVIPGSDTALDKDGQGQVQPAGSAKSTDAQSGSAINPGSATAGSKPMTSSAESGAGANSSSKTK